MTEKKRMYCDRKKDNIICSICGKIKSRQEMSKEKYRQDKCKKCINDLKYQYRLKNKRIKTVERQKQLGVLLNTLKEKKSGRDYITPIIM